MPKTRATKTYHKENLREDLLQAAREVLKDNGHLALSLRALAQQVGVTTAAPYHHFSDRRALLLALAAEGFDNLTQQAQKTLAEALPPREKLLRMGMHFVQFANANPRRFELMYESELTQPSVDPALQTLQESGHAALHQALTEALPRVPASELDLRETFLWATIYGFVTLLNKQMIQPLNTPRPAIPALTESVIARAVDAALASAASQSP